MKKDYTAIKHQLEYFYHIPTDQIASTIAKEISGNNITDPESELQTIFKHVFRSASLYCDFIVADINHTYFNENPGDNLRQGLCQLIYLSLQNNCILNAFFHELACISKPIELSGKNIPTINKSIMDMILQGSNKSNPKGEVDSQQFYNRKKIYKHDCGQNIYTNEIINSLNITQPSDNISSINILQYISPAAGFLFMEDACSKFGRSINSNNIGIFDKYNTLWSQCQKQQANYSTPIDKLIFRTEMEVIFGFNFFSFINNRIESIHKKPISETKGLKDLEGQSFTNIILQLANFPLFFGKDLFFKYISHSFLASPNIESLYFQESAKEMATVLPPPLPKAQQVINGLNLMNNFFQILGSLSLPILFSLWNVVVYELIQKKILSKDLMSIYKEYLVNNCDTIIYNSDCLSDEKIIELSAECLRQGKNLDNDLLLSYISTDKKTDDSKEKKTDDSSSKCIYLNNTSSYTKETMQYLLCRYCSVESLKGFRAPSFFLIDNEFSAYNPLSHFITSLQYHSDSYDTSNDFRVRAFLIDHRKSIFEYLFSTNINPHPSP